MTGSIYCPSCGGVTSADINFCQKCGVVFRPNSSASIPPPASNPQASVHQALGIAPRNEYPGQGGLPQGRADQTMARYRKGYHYAGVIEGLGTFVQVIACCIGGLLVLIGVIGIASSEGNAFGQFAMASSFSLLISGVVVGVVGYVQGVLVKAFGYLLKAQCDCAVNSSHFLNDEQRAKAMSIG
jgi:hypothetical protein